MRMPDSRRVLQGTALAATLVAFGAAHPRPAAAQATGDTGTAQTTAQTDTRDDGFDLGWLGLLGLAGLAGLKRRDPVRHVDTTPRRP